MTTSSDPPPRSTRLHWIFGAIGLVPFLAPLATAAWAPRWGVWALSVQAVYGGLVLTFLGGARFGRALQDPAGASTVALSALPILWALGVLAAPAPRGIDHLAMAAGLALMWVWDAFASDLPLAFRRLRTVLTVLAVAALLLGALLLRRAG